MHTSAVVRQRADDVAERGQRQIDLGGLPQPLGARLRLGLPLAARQVHQVQLPHAHVAPTLHRTRI